MSFRKSNFSNMVLYTPNNRIFNNRLECKKALNINCSQYKKLMELNILIPINRENSPIKPEKTEG